MKAVHGVVFMAWSAGETTVVAIQANPTGISCGENLCAKHLDWLRDELTTIYVKETSKFLKDPWQAREDYIRCYS